MTWWKRQPEIVRDAFGAAPIILVFLVAQQMYGEGGSAPRAVAVVVVMGVALSVRRRWPTATFVAALSTVVVAMTGLEFLAIAGYTLVAYRQGVRTAVVSGVSAVAMTAGFLRYWPVLSLEEMAGDLILIAAIAVLPPVFGSGVRRARRTTAELQSRNTELEVLREQAAEHAVEAERFRIARELHDVVAHHVSAMTVRARAAGHVAGRDARPAEEALTYIAEAGTETLNAMGGFVGSLRGQRASSDPEGLAPQPDLRDIPDLLENFRGTGLVVHAELEPPPAGIAPALGLNTYRIVQEALTNAIRHGGAERAWVRIWFTPAVLHIEVDDNGRGLRTDAPSASHGLIGIGERAALHAGTSALSVSPRGGCRLEATLALGASDCPEPEVLDAPTAGP